MPPTETILVDPSRASGPDGHLPAAPPGPPLSVEPSSFSLAGLEQSRQLVVTLRDNGRPVDRTRAATYDVEPRGAYRYYSYSLEGYELKEEQDPDDEGAAARVLVRSPK